MAYTKGTCLNCDKEFWYVRYRADKNYCSKSCRGRYYYVNKGTYNERSRRSKMSPEEFKEHKREYDKQYLRREYVRSRRAERARERYSTDEYRAYARNRYWQHNDRRYTSEPLVHGYVGHRWFDQVRRVVGNPPREDAPWFDQWADRMGAGVLALLEGRDVAEAVREHNRREYIPNNKQVYISDWEGENEWKHAWLRQVPSAEEEAIKELDLAPTRKERFVGAKSTRKHGKNGSHAGRTNPTRRHGFKEYQDRPGFRRS